MICLRECVLALAGLRKPGISSLSSLLDLFSLGAVSGRMLFMEMEYYNLKRILVVK